MCIYMSYVYRWSVYLPWKTCVAYGIFVTFHFQYKCIRHIFSQCWNRNIRKHHIMECVAHAVCCGTAFHCMRVPPLWHYICQIEFEMRRTHTKKKKNTQQTTTLQNTQTLSNILLVFAFVNLIQTHLYL